MSLSDNAGCYDTLVSEGPFTPSVSINAAMMLAILYLKTMQSLENGLQPHCGDSMFFNENSIASIITELSQN